MKCLKMTRFFDNVPISTKDELTVAAMVHRMVSACPANTHEIHHLVTPTRDRWSPLAELQQLGAGLYSTAALFNHSCDPNIVRCNVGRSMVSVTSRVIRRGEEIVDCYGLPWYSKTRDFRQEITSKFYKFSCVCRACSEHWSTSDMLATLTLQEVPRDKRADLDLDAVRRRVAAAVEQLTGGRDWAGALVSLREAQTCLESLSPPLLELFHLHISVWKAIWLLCGNKKLAKLF